MITIDQLRISDDGGTMYLDAHVNKASYFDDVYIDKVTILTEDQVSELDPLSFGDDYIYQGISSASSSLEQLYEKPAILSGKQLIENKTDDGGWKISFDTNADATSNALSLIFSGKFSVFTDKTPILVVTNADFTPSQGFDSGNILFSVKGTLLNDTYDPAHPIYQFKGNGNVKDYNTLKFYLFVQNADSTHTFVSIEDTDNVNFLHFYYMPYSNVAVEGTKEIHMVLGVKDFNEKFSATDLSQNMFFVYISAKGTPSSDTPCRLDEMTTLGVTFDYGWLFNKAMEYTKELGDSCNVPSRFIDFILNYEALRFAIETEHYIPAIKHWQWLKGDWSGASSSGTKDCGCHG